MAATPLPLPPASTSFLFDIYTDGPASLNTHAPNSNLPCGPCNFVDLAHGPNGARCGCRRFWSHQVAGAADQTGWCMCSHHACFHDDAPTSQGQGTPAAPTPAPVIDPTPGPGQENEKPRSNREPLSPVQDFASLHMPSNLGASLDFATLNFDSFAINLATGANPMHADSVAHEPDKDSLPDTLSWRNLPASQGGHTYLPPNPSQCLMPSQSGSTTASSQIRYLQPFGGKGLNTLSSVPHGKVRDTQTNKCGHDTGDGGVTRASRKEGKTSGAAISISSGPPTPNAGLSQKGDGSRPATATRSSTSHEAIHNLTELFNVHDERLEKLENPSFDGANHDDCIEKYDQTDIRVTDLESRMDDVEKKLNDDSTSIASSRRINQQDDDATISMVSAASNVTLRGVNRSDEMLLRQLQALQARVNKLEASSLPSYTSPWEVEVVFLPFPLRGIWMEARDFPTQRRSGDLTQLPNTNTRATPEPQALSSSEWVGQDSDWLLPRACAPSRMIDRRLRSRGLVKTVSIRGCDAHSVQMAIGNAFESTLQTMPFRAGPYDHRSSYAPDPRVGKYLGLQQPWVPLRKRHKDSRLRFLSSAEMITPVLWDVAFLMSSVVMKASGMQRLYVTQPAAYLQDHNLLGYHGIHSGWTWQKLRELPRVYPESQSSNATSDVPEADALEECWTWNDRLDEPPSSHSSMASLHQPREKPHNVSRTSDGSSQQFFTGLSSTRMSTSPVQARAQSPALQRDRRSSRPPHVRTGSLPPASAPVVTSPAYSQRRMPSYTLIHHGGPNYQRYPSPLVGGRPSPRTPAGTNAPAAMVTKYHRRNTRSPSLRPHNTPRWSSRSYSRSPSMAPHGFNGMPMEEVRSQRRTTPFAYATPFSNAPAEYQQMRHASRSRSVNVYEDEDMDVGDENHGSSTDAYGDSDIDIYKDEADMLDDIDNEAGEDHEAHAEPLRESQDVQHVQDPADEPWPGIEDNMSDGENVDPFEIEAPRDDDDGARDDQSDVSSQPSEYPSTQRAWRLPDDREMTAARDDEGGIGFKIHEDEEQDNADDDDD